VRGVGKSSEKIKKKKMHLFFWGRGGEEGGGGGGGGVGALGIKMGGGAWLEAVPSGWLSFCSGIHKTLKGTRGVGDSKRFKESRQVQRCPGAVGPGGLCEKRKGGGGIHRGHGGMGVHNRGWKDKEVRLQRPRWWRKNIEKQGGGGKGVGTTIIAEKVTKENRSLSYSQKKHTEKMKGKIGYKQEKKFQKIGIGY